MNKSFFFSRITTNKHLLKAIDLLIVIFAGYVVHYLRFEDTLSRNSYQLFLLVLVLVTYNLFNLLSVYRIERGEYINKELTRLTLAWLVVIITMSALMFMTKTGAEYSRLWAGWTFLVIYFLMILSRIASNLIVRRLRSKGYNQNHVVILGAGSVGKRACDTLISNPWLGIKPIAFFDDDKNTHDLTHKDVKVIGDTSSATNFIEKLRSSGKYPVDQVWIALPLSSAPKIEQLQIELQDTATKVYLVPDIFGFTLSNYNVDHVAGLPIMNMNASTMNGVNAIVKRVEDFMISSILLLTLSPLFLVIGALIKQESRGPVFFKQRRYGEDGREILVWKFRSMTVTEDGNDIQQAKRDDQRVTKIGGFLRKSSLDEIPQLINVFLGTMSLVGPRPHAVAHNEYYRKKVKGYMTRHQIKPGITGLAQIKGFRGETAELQDMEQRVHYDLEYIRNWTIFLDFRILFLTIPSLFKNKNVY